MFTYEMLMGRSPFYNRSRTQMYERIVNEVCLDASKGLLSHGGTSRFMTISARQEDRAKSTTASDGWVL